MISGRLVLGGLLAGAIAAASIIGCSSRQPLDERFVLPDRPLLSPSGEFAAQVDDGPVQNGVHTWVVVITDATGSEVFRDDYAYSTRHGVAVTWLSTRDQLWILSADVGTSYVGPGADGVWVKIGITPETLDSIPDEIEILRSGQ